MNDDNDRPSALRYRGRWQRRGVGLLWVAAVVVACALVLAAAVSCGEDAPLSTVTVDAPAPGADTQQPPVQIETEASAAASLTVPTTTGDAGGGSDGGGSDGGAAGEADAEAVADAVAEVVGEGAAAGRLQRVREAGAADEQPAEAGPLAHIDPTTTTTTTARPRPAPTTTRPGDLPAPTTTAPAPTGHVHVGEGWAADISRADVEAGRTWDYTRADGTVFRQPRTNPEGLVICDYWNTTEYPCNEQEQFRYDEMRSYQRNWLNGSL